MYVSLNRFKYLHFNTLQNIGPVNPVCPAPAWCICTIPHATAGSLTAAVNSCESLVQKNDHLWITVGGTIMEDLIPLNSWLNFSGFNFDIQKVFLIFMSPFGLRPLGFKK